jgi:hypothetical protein
VQEKGLVSTFFDEISQDTGKLVFSVKVSEQLGGKCAAAHVNLSCYAIAKGAYIKHLKKV